MKTLTTEKIKQYMIDTFGHFPQDVEQLTEFINGLLSDINHNG